MDLLLGKDVPRDLSTIMIATTRGCVPAKTVRAWLQMLTPMNHKFARIIVEGMEVGEALTLGIETILKNPEFSKCKYVLTCDDDNIPPADGLLRLLEKMDGSEYDVIGGLYWTKEEHGYPLIMGNPKDPKDFTPQIPYQELQECNGMGTGFTLYRLSMFRELESPYFKTINQRLQKMNQDLYFFWKAKEKGFRFAVLTSLLVGHLDNETGMIYPIKR